MAKKLYGIVQWTNDNPILDGIVYFIEKKEALEYMKILENITTENFNVTYTIIRMYRG